MTSSLLGVGSYTLLRSRDVQLSIEGSDERSTRWVWLIAGQRLEHPGPSVDRVAYAPQILWPQVCLDLSSEVWI